MNCELYVIGSIQHSEDLTILHLRTLRMKQACHRKFGIVTSCCIFWLICAYISVCDTIWNYVILPHAYGVTTVVMVTLAASRVLQKTICQYEAVKWYLCFGWFYSFEHCR